MKTLFFAFALAVLTACGAGKADKDAPVLAEARKIHTEANKIHVVVMKDIKEVNALRESLEKKLAEAKDKKAKPEELASLEKEISACKDQDLAMKDWMKNNHGVPGEEHDHHEGHDHTHDHAPATQASASDILAFQKEMKQKIEKIQQEVNALLKK